MIIKPKPSTLKNDKKLQFIKIGDHRLIYPKTHRWSREPLATIDVSGSDIIIEKDVIISSGVFILTHSHNFKEEKWRKLTILQKDGPTVLRKRCFLGVNSIVLYSCKYIGISSVVGAGSVVLKDVPDYEIWVGNPARKIGEVNKSENIS